VSHLAGAESAIRVLSVAADGENWLVGCQDGVARMWGTGGEERGAVFRVSQTEVSASAMTADAAMLAVGGMNGSVEIWGLDWQIDTYEAPDWETRLQPLLRSYLGAKKRGRHFPSPFNLLKALSTNGDKVNQREKELDEVRAFLRPAGYGWLSTAEISRMVAACRQ